MSRAECSDKSDIIESRVVWKTRIISNFNKIMEDESKNDGRKRV